jgi:citrate lyase subunit beta/citryl-CoA lyase
MLFAPGDSDRKAAKALASNADGVILDLEDSVALTAKDAARALTAALLRGASRPVIVRVNPRGTPWYLADLAATVPSRPAAVLLPKCAGMADLVALDHHLEALEAAHGLPVGSTGMLALITESAMSLRAMDYVGPPARLWALCFGAEDLAADFGIASRGAAGYPAPIAAARAMALLAAAQAGVPAIDTPWPDPRDPAGLALEAAAAAADGFAGKLCIHPAQIDAVNAAFDPPPARLAWATRVRDAFAASPEAGVISLDGAMIDQPHLKAALRILAAATGS